MFRCVGVALVIALLLMSCNFLSSVSGSPSTTPIQSGATLNVTDSVPNNSATRIVPALPAVTNTSVATPTSAIPSDVVVVNTFDQEVYPFKQDGNCSLGEAIQTVLIQQVVDGCVLPAGSHTIYMPKGTYALTQPDNAPVVLFGTKPQKNREGFDPAGFPMIANTLIILGNGSTIQRTGPHKFGIFQVFAGGGNLTLKDLTISGGDATANNAGDYGGGAINVMGFLTLDHVTLTDNLANEGGALDAEGEVTVVDSTITQNTSKGDGGGIYNGNGQLLVKNSVISSNVADPRFYQGGGIYIDFNAQLTLDNSQIVGNIAQEGGGIYTDGGSIKINNQSVISGNVAAEKNQGSPHGGGGININESVGETAQLTIDNSFVIGNQAPGTTGGGIFNEGQMTVTGSVLANNVGGAGGAIDTVASGQGSVTGSCILENQSLWPDTSGGIENDADITQVVIDARRNWWGSASGPGGAASSQVDTNPVLTSPPAICAGAIPTPYPTPSGK